MITYNQTVKASRAFNIWNQCKPGIANNFYLTLYTRQKLLHLFPICLEIQNERRPERVKKKLKCHVHNSKTLQSEYLICPANSMTRMSKTGLVANWMKAERADDGILRLSQSIYFLDHTGLLKGRASHHLNDLWTQDQGEIDLLEVRAHLHSAGLQSVCTVHNYFYRIQFVKESKFTW